MSHKTIKTLTTTWQPFLLKEILLVAMPGHFLKIIFTFSFLVISNMILKLNIKLYSGKNSFFDEVIACQTCTPSTPENFNVFKMIKSQPLLSSQRKM